MQHVQSADGTQIAYDRVGTGPALALTGLARPSAPITNGASMVSS